MILSLFLVIILLSGALAVVLYTLTKQSSWRVNVQYGLALTDQNDIPVATLDFVVDRYGTQVKTFKIKNTSNNAVNVTQVMPNNTAYYSFATSFVNSTIVKDGFVLFTISLTDLNMNAELLYSGEFDWKIVDHFSVGYEEPQKVSFEPSQIVYSDDTTPYLSFVSESFDKTEYNLSETVQYSFTTGNPNENYSLQSYSYHIDVFNESGVFQTRIFEGMSGSMLNLTIGETNTITHVFNAPLFNGTYYLSLVYTGHNSEYTYVPQEYNVAVTIYYTTENGGHTWNMDTLFVEDRGMSGFTKPSELSAFQIQLKNYDVVLRISNYEIRIVETGYVIGSGQATVNPSNTWASPVYYFVSPNLYGNYTIQISVQFVPPSEYTYTVTTYYVDIAGRHCDWKVSILKIESWSVTNFTAPSQASSITLTLKNYGAGQQSCNYEIKILETGSVIASGQVTVNPSNTWTGTFSFTSPSVYGNYTIQISSTQISNP
jgi:hypothetical protein